MQQPKRNRSVRKGAAVLELAVLLPLLVFLFVIGVDFARVFYHTVTVTNSARNGAIYASKDATYAADEAGIREAVLADAKNLSPAPKVTSTTGKDEQGHPCVKVTVEWKFNTISRFPGVPDTMMVTRTVQMRIAPHLPKGSI
jgi:Flp pilus assembly protein TadG